MDHFAGLERTGEPCQDVERFLAPRRPETWRHTLAVAERALALAPRFSLDPEAVRLAAYSHDLAAVVPRPNLVATAEAWGVSLTAEDRAIPQVLHGPLAAAVIEARLSVRDIAILDAVRYHTTLRSHATPLDLLLFVADKIAFDPTTPRLDYLAAMQSGLERSLEGAAWAYLDFVVGHVAELGWRLHPNLVAAHAHLRAFR